MTRFNFKPFSPILKTGQTTVYSANDDGTYQKGRVIGTRFVDNGDNTITDLATGLMWVKDVASIGGGFSTTATWADAITACEGLTYAGQTDWRLPNCNELLSLVDHSVYNPSINTTFFSNVVNGNYHTSTTYRYSTSRNCAVSFGLGLVNNITKGTSAYVFPVRGGSAAQVITGKTLNEFGIKETCLPTYQSTGYATGDDATYKYGASSYPRVVDNGNGTATDMLTGLMWVKSYVTTQRTWTAAISYCESLNYGNYTDWRLPNVNELSSLIHYDKASPQVIGGGILTPTIGTTGGRCAASTTNAQTTTRNFVVYFQYTSIQTVLKTGSNYVWACRGGK